MPSIKLESDSRSAAARPNKRARRRIASPGSISRILLVLLLTWDILILAELMLHVRLDDGLFNLSFVPTSMSLSLFASGHLFNLLIIMLVGIPALASFMLMGKRLWHPLLITISWLVALTYFSSWYYFSFNHTFLTVDAIRIFLNSPVQFYQHITHTFAYRAVLLPLVILGIVWAGIATSRRILDFFRNRNARATNRLLAGHLLLCAIILLCARLLPGRELLASYEMDPRSMIERQMVKFHTELLEFNTNPIATLLLDALHRMRLKTRLVTTLDDSLVQRNPLISLEDYLQGVEPAILDRKNIIVLLVESLRPDELRAFGGPRTVMKHLDTLAMKSLRFTDTYTQASHSSYADLCPLNSHYPLRSRAVHFYPRHAPYPRVRIYDVLNSLGYRTAIISSQNEKWGSMHNYLDSEGLDYFLHADNFRGNTYTVDEDVGFASFVRGNKLSGKIDDRLTISEVIKWIGDENKDPFFVYINLQNSHIPFPVPADFEKKFSPAEPDFPLYFADFPKDKIGEVKDFYSDSLRYVDAQIGRLLGFLKERGIMDDTIVVVTGDTGQAFYEHGFASHASYIYNEVMKVPLIIYDSDSEGGEDPRPTQHIDVPPTLLSMLGLPEHPSFQGLDLTTAEPVSDRSRYLMVQTGDTQYGIVKNNYKLIHWPRTGRIELYDLNRDPGERINLSSQRPELAQNLMDRLQRWVLLQLDYYETSRHYTTSYPPRYLF